MTEAGEPLASLRAIRKDYGSVRVLNGVDFDVHPGRVLAVMGHNGAGKSTLMQILAGTTPRSGGTIALAGAATAEPYDADRAQSLGVRCVFQELSLCPNLTVTENTRLVHPALRGRGWRRRARALILAKLDEIYPGHGIDPDMPVADLSIARRQVVETARAFTATDRPLRIVILDEPTSALDVRSAGQLLAHMRRAAAQGIAVLFISHRMDEIFEHTDEIAVMRDGRVVGRGASASFSPATLIEMMGMVEAPTATGSRRAAGADAPARVREGEFQAPRGCIVGLAGLDGHGQRQLLHRIFEAGRAPARGGPSVDGTVAYVAGDRQAMGIFPLWSIVRNISSGLRGSLVRRGVVHLGRERRLAEEWQRRLGIRAPSLQAPITALSGGNQQKVLVARAFARDADIVLLDDPLRGVDVGTKRELYAAIRGAAEAGSTFIWYTSELAELEHCDIVYVYYMGEVSAVIPHAELTEQKVLSASFGRTQ